MTYWKFFYRILGGHTHVRIFSAPGPDRTYGKNGDIIFRNEEWDDFRAQFGEKMALYFDEGEKQTAPEKAHPAEGLGPRAKIRKYMEDR